MENIQVATMLAEIDKMTGQNLEFTIGFVSLKSAEYREIQAVKKPGGTNKKGGSEKAKTFHSVKFNRLLMIHDIEENQPKNIKVDLIQTFNGHRVIH